MILNQTIWFYLVIIGTIVWVFLTSITFNSLKKVYTKKETISPNLSISIWSVEVIHVILVSSTFFISFLNFKIDGYIHFFIGSILILIGFVIMLLGMNEFKSLKRMSGLDNSILVKSGIYKKTRNPQYLGWFIFLIGLSLIVSSILAFIYVLVFIIIMHIRIIRLEEPYLLDIFGEEYKKYKNTVPRYFKFFSKQII